MRIPIPFPKIKDMPDTELVPCIQAMKALETAQFFYGKAAPIFMKLYNGYYTDCTDTVEFINDFYVDLMSVRAKAKTRKIDSFAYECMFKNWIGKLALMYCYDQYEKRMEKVELEVVPAGEIDEGVKENLDTLDRRDVDAILNMMPNPNYRDLLRMVYLDGMSLQEAAVALDVTMDNFFNMHRRAKLQYIQAYNKEMRR